MSQIPSVESLFFAALEKPSPEERAAFLAEACGEDLDVRRRVERLLDAHSNVGSFLQAAAPSPLTTESDPLLERPGTHIGPYKLMEQIGEGGMGLVFVAEQEKPVRRKVALKIIKPGMDTREVIARFEAERQALALMDHPNIAKVLDAGATDSGRPYFVMELVKGVPLTDYCDDHQLTPRERLELFVGVCQAMQHAHTKGVIHRDLKPNNVLVAPHDGKPVVKVIDFGVAKAIGQALTDKTIYTRLNQMIGTPLYMSPEQAEINALDVDTRSDVYGLGVLLYELLTGATPFDRQKLQKAAFDEIRRIIREEEPPKPSTRLTTLGAGLSDMSAKRKTEPGKLSAMFKGDLDWIVMKALEKDRTRRYETASAFAEDVRRFLRDQPVEARPPSAWYRLKKFTKRHKGQVAAAGLVLLALLAGIAGTTYGMVRAEKAAEAERQANAHAQERLKQIEKGTEILASVFHDLDPTSEEKEGVSLRVLLGRHLGEAVQQLDGEAVGDPVVTARLQSLLGIALLELGHYEQAEAVLPKTQRTLEEALGADHPDSLSVMLSVAVLYQFQGKYPQAETLFKKVLAGRTAQLGANHSDTIVAKHDLAYLYHRCQGRYPESETLLNEVLQSYTDTLGGDHLDTLTAKKNLAVLYQDQGKFPQAEKLFLEVLAGRNSQLGPNHPHTLSTMNDLAVLYHRCQGKLLPAEKLFLDAVKGFTAQLGAEHPETLIVKQNLAVLYQDQRKYAEAEKLFNEVLAGRLSQLGIDHPYTNYIKNDLAVFYHRCLGDLSRSENLYNEVVERLSARLGADHPDSLNSKENLALLYQDQMRFTEAEDLFKKVLVGFTIKFGADHYRTLITKNHLAVLYGLMRRFELSIPQFQKLLEEKRRIYGPEHPETLHTLADLGVNYREADRLDDGILRLEEALVAIRKLPEPVPSKLTFVFGELGQAYSRAKQYAKADPLHREYVQQVRQLYGDDDPRTASGIAQLALSLLAQKNHSDAEPLLRECLKIRERKLPDDWRTFNTKSMLGEALLGQKKNAEAEPLLKDGYEGLKQRQDTIPEPYRTIRLTETLERLVQFYEAIGNKEEAAKWRKKLEAMKATDKN